MLRELTDNHLSIKPANIYLYIIIDKHIMKLNKSWSLIAQLEELALTSFGVIWLVCWLVGVSHSLAQHKNQCKCNTVLERGQIAHEDPTIKNLDFQSQESGTSFMSPKGHILT